MRREHRGTSATGGSTSWDASLYDDCHSFVWKLGGDLLDLLAPVPGERILDLGCGTGALTAAIAERGAEVLGIDSSPEMVEQARRRYPALRFDVTDGREFSFPLQFDAIFSNAALHWMSPPERVVESVRRALRPGGRLVAEFGGKGNVRAILEALRAALRAEGYPACAEVNPWYFPSISEYAGLLEGRGMSVRYAELRDRPTRLEEGEMGLRNWLRMFAGAFFERVPGDSHESLWRTVEDSLRPSLFRDGAWYADYRRLRLLATRE